MTYSRLCAHCTETLEPGNPIDPDSIMHEECLVRATIGSVPHQMKQCSCHGGTMEEPTDKTQRQNALAAFCYYFRARIRATASANELKSGMVN